MMKYSESLKEMPESIMLNHAKKTREFDTSFQTLGRNVGFSDSKGLGGIRRPVHRRISESGDYCLFERMFELSAAGVHDIV